MPEKTEAGREVLDAIRDGLFASGPVVEAEGARVAFVVCRECGAAIVLDHRESIDSMATHLAWHRSLREYLGFDGTEAPDEEYCCTPSPEPGEAGGRACQLPVGHEGDHQCAGRTTGQRWPRA